MRLSPALGFSTALLATALLAACEAPAPRADARRATPAPPLFENFGELHRDIGTPVPAAQRYFDQGMRLVYGFNHEAAGNAFAEAAQLDPQCAMCVWGQALVLGPNINLPMSPDLAPQATALAQKALSLADNAKPADRALIEALAKRYADPAPADRAPLDKAYADAMANVVAHFPRRRRRAGHVRRSADGPHAVGLLDAAASRTRDTPKIIGALETVLEAQSATHRRDPLLHPRGRSVR